MSFTIFPDAQGQARLSLYEDDGVSQAYLKDGFRRTVLSYKTATAGAEIEIGAPQGTYQAGARPLIFTVQSARSGMTTALVDGAALPQREASGAGRGWWKSGTSVSIQIDDDGRAHKIELR